MNALQLGLTLFGSALIDEADSQGKRAGAFSKPAKKGNSFRYYLTISACVLLLVLFVQLFIGGSDEDHPLTGIAETSVAIPGPAGGTDADVSQPTTPKAGQGVGGPTTAPQETTPAARASTGGHKVGKKNQIGCVSKDALDEVNKAAMNQDKKQFYLLFNDRKCFILEGYRFSVVETDWGKARIRVYEGGGSVILWTPVETTQ
jgi:hypothetical protein